MNVQVYDAPKTRQIRSKPRGIEVTVPFFCPPERIPARICLSDITMPTLRKNTQLYHGPLRIQRGAQPASSGTVRCRADFGDGRHRSVGRLYATVVHALSVARTHSGA